jgi:hypothetical protein
LGEAERLEHLFEELRFVVPVGAGLRSVCAKPLKIAPLKDAVLVAQFPQNMISLF